ncbi:hypothetical protein [Flavivirga eckloniae]|nr:hypothetical protein [Flavivirga eckloniae]
MMLTKIHTYFWIAAAIIYISGFIYYGTESVIDINIHDTYYVMSCFNLMTLLTLTLIFIGFGYWIFFKFTIQLYKLLIFIHILISIGSILSFILVQIYFDNINPNPNFPLFNDSSNGSIALLTIVLLFLVGQLIFIINLIISLIRKSINQINRKS